MVALKSREIAAHLQNRAPNIWLYLVYGADETLVQERARHLATQVVKDLNDPFNTISISQCELKANPAILVDEASALSFTGGLRLIRIQISGESAPVPIKALVDYLDKETFSPNAVTIIEAGSLSKRSSLRKLVEKAKSAAALPCYDDTPKDTNALIYKTLFDAGFTLEPEAKTLLTEKLALITGGNRGFIRQEIEKLILYMGPARTPSPTAIKIKAEDIKASLSDGQSESTSHLADLILSGKTPTLSKALGQIQDAGVPEIACLRAIYRTFFRAYTAQNLIREGMSVAAAMKALRPPVFFAEEQKFRAYLSSWNAAQLEQALTRLTEAELAVKSTGKPAREIMERTALQLAAMGARLVHRAR